MMVLYIGKLCIMTVDSMHSHNYHSLIFSVYDLLPYIGTPYEIIIYHGPKLFSITISYSTCQFGNSKGLAYL
jgi:hypothetical protein